MNQDINTALNMHLPKNKKQILGSQPANHSQHDDSFPQLVTSSQFF